MRKLLVAAGAKELSAATLDFSAYLARLTGSGLTGIFLEPLRHASVPVTSMEQDILYIQSVPYTGMEANEAVRARCDQMVVSFREACEARQVTGIAHRERLTPWHELLEETRYADALIIDSDFTLHAHLLEEYPSRYAKKMLHEAHCPVIIAPLTFGPVEEIFFTYDGSDASIFAMRQFVYLFPELTAKPAVLLEIVDGEDGQPKEQHRLKEWLNSHFSQVAIVMLKGSPRERLMEFTLSHPRAFIVMGGFGRSRGSRLLHPSLSAPVVRMASAPVFIAHHLRS